MIYYFTLPIPPSTNNIYLNGAKGRFKSPKATKWVNDALLMLAPIPYPLEGDLEVCYTLTFADKRMRDIANYEKLLTDTLVKRGIMNDDSQIAKMTIDRLTPDKLNSWVVGYVKELT